MQLPAPNALLAAIGLYSPCVIGGISLESRQREVNWRYNRRSARRIEPPKEGVEATFDSAATGYRGGGLLGCVSPGEKLKEFPAAAPPSFLSSRSSRPHRAVGLTLTGHSFLLDSPSRILYITAFLRLCHKWAYYNDRHCRMETMTPCAVPQSSRTQHHEAQPPFFAHAPAPATAPTFQTRHSAFHHLQLRYLSRTTAIPIGAVHLTTARKRSGGAAAEATAPGAAPSPGGRLFAAEAAE